MNTKIVIIDNVPAQQNLLENMLKQMGHESILKFRTAKEAIHGITQETDIGLIISEWDLPEKSGLDFVKIIKLNSKLNTIPVILAFKTKPKEDILEASQSGVVGFIIKPYKLAILKNKISGILKAETTQPESKGKIPSMENIDLTEI